MSTRSYPIASIHSITPAKKPIVVATTSQTQRILNWNLKLMPSMRSLWTADEALEREHIGYNCAYTTIDSIKSFTEIDDAPYTFDEVCLKLECFEAVVFTSYSHSEQAPKYRVYLPLHWNVEADPWGNR